MTPNPTHCLDCHHSLFHDGLCANPAVATLDDEQRAQYDDPLQACPVFVAKPILIPLFEVVG